MEAEKNILTPDTKSRFCPFFHKVWGRKGRNQLINMIPIILDNHTFLAISVRLPKTNLLAVASEKGYIMCGALDVGLLNDKLRDRKILAGRATGVKSIEELLEAPLESVTWEAVEKGIHPGMIGKEALIKMI